MMAEKARLFYDHDAAARIMSSPDPREHKRICRAVRNFDCATWDRVREDAVLAGTFAKFTQNPAMKQHLMSTGSKLLAEASPFDTVWGIGLRADDPEAQDPRRWQGKNLLGKALSAVRDTIRASEAGLAHPASYHRFCTPSSPDGIHEISPAPPRPLAMARACPGPPPEFSTYFSDAPADHSSEVLAISPGVHPSLSLSEQGPCLVEGTITLDDAYFTTKIAIHSGAGALAPSGCVALLDTGSPQTFIRRDVLDRMLSVGAASLACEQKFASRSWGGFGVSAPLQTSTSIRLSVQFFRTR